MRYGILKITHAIRHASLGKKKFILGNLHPAKDASLFGMQNKFDDSLFYRANHPGRDDNKVKNEWIFLFTATEVVLFLNKVKIRFLLLFFPEAGS
jgi:hypothetical protein